MRARELFVDDSKEEARSMHPLQFSGVFWHHVTGGSQKEDMCVFAYELISPDLDRTDIRSTLGPIMIYFTAGFLAILLQELGLNLGFVYMSMGVLIGSAVGPASLAILYEKANGIAGQIHSEAEIACRFDVRCKPEKQLIQGNSVWMSCASHNRIKSSGSG